MNLNGEVYIVKNRPRAPDWVLTDDLALKGDNVIHIGRNAQPELIPHNQVQVEKSERGAIWRGSEFYYRTPNLEPLIYKENKALETIGDAVIMRAVTLFSHVAFSLAAQRPIKNLQFAASNGYMGVLPVILAWNLGGKQIIHVGEPAFIAFRVAALLGVGIMRGLPQSNY